MLKSSSSEKKLVKPLKNCFFGPNLHRKGVIMDHAQDEKNCFLVEITKADHQLSESFYFIKISYVLTELRIFFYLWVMLSVKKVLFPVLIAPKNEQHQMQIAWHNGAPRIFLCFFTEQTCPIWWGEFVRIFNNSLPIKQARHHMTTQQYLLVGNFKSNVP